MDISSRTPEGEPNRCPACGNRFRLDPSRPPGDAPCPFCGTLVWFPGPAFEVLPDRWKERSAAAKKETAAKERPQKSIVKFMPTASLLRAVAWGSFLWLAVMWMERRWPLAFVYVLLGGLVVAVMQYLVSAWRQFFGRVPEPKTELDLPLTWWQAALVVVLAIALGVGSSWLFVGRFR
jgi:hypothetical protein